MLCINYKYTKMLRKKEFNYPIKKEQKLYGGSFCSIRNNNGSDTHTRITANYFNLLSFTGLR